MALPLLAGAVIAQANLPAPTGLTVTAPPAPAGVSRLDLRWEKVPGAMGYEILQLRNGKWWFNEDDPNRTPLTTSTSISGLEPQTSYEFCVRAVGGSGISSAMSTPVGARTQGRQEINVSSNPTTRPTPGQSDVLITSGKDKGKAPEAPSGIFGTFPQQDRIKLSWRPVPGASGYVIEEMKEGVWKPAEDIVGAREATSVIIINHPTPGPYKFRLRAIGTNGKFSEPSWEYNMER